MTEETVSNMLLSSAKFKNEVKDPSEISLYYQTASDVEKKKLAATQYRKSVSLSRGKALARAQKTKIEVDTKHNGIKKHSDSAWKMQWEFLSRKQQIKDDHLASAIYHSRQRVRDMYAKAKVVNRATTAPSLKQASVELPQSIEHFALKNAFVPTIPCRAEHNFPSPFSSAGVDFKAPPIDLRQFDQQIDKGGACYVTPDGAVMKIKDSVRGSIVKNKWKMQPKPPMRQRQPAKTIEFVHKERHVHAKPTEISIGVPGSKLSSHSYQKLRGARPLKTHKQGPVTPNKKKELVVGFRIPLDNTEQLMQRHIKSLIAKERNRFCFYGKPKVSEILIPEMQVAKKILTSTFISPFHKRRCTVNDRGKTNLVIPTAVRERVDHAKKSNENSLALPASPPQCRKEEIYFDNMSMTGWNSTEEEHLVPI